MYPKNHGKRSARLRGKNSTTWGALPIESSGEEIISNYTKNNPNVGSSKRIQKRRKINGGGQCANSDQLAAVRTEMILTGCVDPKNRGRRSVRRPRGNIPASWVSTMDGLQSFKVAVVSKLGKNVQEVVSNKMESSQEADTVSCNASRDEAKVEELCGADIVVQTDVAMVDMKEGIGADASDTSSAPMAANSAEVNVSYANGTEHTGASTMRDTSVEAKDSNHADANAVTDTTAELKVSNCADANFVVHLQAGVRTTSTLADIKESNGEMADAIVKSAVQTTDAVDPQQGRANDTESDSKTFLGLDLGNGDCNVDLSRAESALASLYGQYNRDFCIEFAVKLLMNEIQLPKEAAEVEEFFTQTMKATRA